MQISDLRSMEHTACWRWTSALCVWFSKVRYTRMWQSGSQVCIPSSTFCCCSLSMNLARERTPNVATLLQWVTSALHFSLSDGSSYYQSDFWQPQLLHNLTKTYASFTSHIYDPSNSLQAVFHLRWAWKLNFTIPSCRMRHSFSYAAFNCRNVLVHVSYPWHSAWTFCHRRPSHVFLL